MWRPYAKYADPSLFNTPYFMTNMFGPETFFIFLTEFQYWCLLNSQTLDVMLVLSKNYQFR